MLERQALSAAGAALRNPTVERLVVEALEHLPSGAGKLLASQEPRVAALLKQLGLLDSTGFDPARLALASSHEMRTPIMNVTVGRIGPMTKSILHENAAGIFGAGSPTRILETRGLISKVGPEGPLLDTIFSIEAGASRGFPVTMGLNKRVPALFSAGDTKLINSNPMVAERAHLTFLRPQTPNSPPGHLLRFENRAGLFVKKPVGIDNPTSLQVRFRNPDNQGTMTAAFDFATPQRIPEIRGYARRFMVTNDNAPLDTWVRSWVGL